MRLAVVVERRRSPVGISHPEDRRAAMRAGALAGSAHVAEQKLEPQQNLHELCSVVVVIGRVAANHLVSHRHTRCTLSRMSAPSTSTPDSMALRIAESEGSVFTRRAPVFWATSAETLALTISTISFQSQSGSFTSAFIYSAGIISGSRMSTALVSRRNRVFVGVLNFLWPFICITRTAYSR